MSKRVFLPSVSLAAITLLFSLMLPCSAWADPVEEIPEIEEQVQQPPETAVQNKAESRSIWDQLLDFMGLDDETPVTETPAIKPTVTAGTDEAEKPVAQQGETEGSTAGKAAAEKAAEKADAERLAAEKAERERIAAEKAATEKAAAEKADADRLAAEKAEREKVAAEKAAAEKPAEKTDQARVPADKAVAEHMGAEKVEVSDTPSPSLWQSLLASVGLYDDRKTIPPLEVKNTPQQGQDYIIGPGDVLGISVWRDDSLTKTVVVLPDGKIQFPLAGEIVAGGKSVSQLKQEFVEKLADYIVDADVSVEVKQSNSLFVYIIGKVNGPGRQILLADTTVLQALAMAGGLNTFAEKDDIKIFRRNGDRTTVYSFRYSQVVSGNNLDDNVLLKRGDVIVVP